MTASGDVSLSDLPLRARGSRAEPLPVVPQATPARRAVRSCSGDKTKFSRRTSRSTSISSTPSTSTSRRDAVNEAGGRHLRRRSVAAAGPHAPPVRLRRPARPTGTRADRRTRRAAARRPRELVASTRRSSSRRSSIPSCAGARRPLPQGARRDRRRRTDGAPRRSGRDEARHELVATLAPLLARDRVADVVLVRRLGSAGTAAPFLRRGARASRRRGGSAALRGTIAASSRCSRNVSNA